MQELAADHDYYCSTSNFFSNDASEYWDTWPEFYAEYNDADIDMNLVFRWDVIRSDDGSFSMNVFFIRQRKGIFSPIIINEVTEADVETIVLFLQKHWNKLESIWHPISAER